MKLLYCPKCRDIRGLYVNQWIQCICKSSGGQYNEDGFTVTIGGLAKVLGIDNEFLNGNNNNNKIWFGGDIKDLQVYRKESSTGPRYNFDEIIEILSNKIDGMRVIKNE